MSFYVPGLSGPLLPHLPDWVTEGAVEAPDSITWGDKMRTMTNEELAKMLGGTCPCLDAPCPVAAHGGPDCVACWLAFLQSRYVEIDNSSSG